MPLIAPRRLRFSLNSIFLLSLGIAIGYAWNLWVWRVEHFMGSEAHAVLLPSYVIEPPDVLQIEALDKGSSTQAISGVHLVAMDGRINLGDFGTINVAGLTVPETEDAIERKLSGKLDSPQVAVVVAQYSSKSYYIIVEEPGLGSNVTRAVITGDDNVLDAIAMAGFKVTDNTEVWISRPAPNGVGPQRNIPVNFQAITRDAVTARNYQVLPGDRVFISQKEPADQSTAAAKGSPKR